MKYRKLRIAWSVAWGVACLLLIALWVRSYWIEIGSLGHLSEHRIYRVAIVLGRLTAWQSEVPDDGRRPLPFEIYSIKALEWWVEDETLGFGFGEYVIVPMWSLTLAAAVLAAVPWMRLRFSYVGACQVAIVFTCLPSVG